MAERTRLETDDFRDPDLPRDRMVGLHPLTTSEAADIASRRKLTRIDERLRLQNRLLLAVAFLLFVLIATVGVRPI